MLLSDYRKLCMPPEISARILPFGKFAQLSGSRTECSWWLLQSNQNHQDRGYQDTFDVYDNLNMLVSQISASNMPHLLPNNAVYFAPQHASFAANAAAAACSTDSSRHSHTWRKIGIKIGENKCKSGQAYAKILHSQHVVPGDPRVRSYHDLPKYMSAGWCDQCKCRSWKRSAKWLWKTDIHKGILHLRVPWDVGGQ